MFGLACQQTQQEDAATQSVREPQVDLASTLRASQVQTMGRSLGPSGPPLKVPPTSGDGEDYRGPSDVAAVPILALTSFQEGCSMGTEEGHIPWGSEDAERYHPTH